jgi:hypothetical protein
MRVHRQMYMQAFTGDGGWDELITDIFEDIVRDDL